MSVSLGYFIADQMRKNTVKELPQLSENPSARQILKRMITEHDACDTNAPLNPNIVMFGLTNLCEMSKEEEDRFRKTYSTRIVKLYEEMFAEFLSDRAPEIAKNLNEGQAWF